MKDTKRHFARQSALLMALFVAGSLLGSTAWATCSPATTIQPHVMNMRSVTTATGSDITDDPDYSTYSTSVACDNEANPAWQGLASPVERLPNTNYFKTNVDGVGLQLNWKHNGWNETVNSIIQQADRNFSDSTTPQLVAQFKLTKPISRGVHTVDLSPFRAQYYLESPHGVLLADFTLSPITITVTGESCDLDTSVITVPLKTISLRDLESGESAIVSPSDTQIRLNNCDAGVEPAVDFYASNISPDSLILYPNAGSTAQGMGLQLLIGNNNQIINLSSGNRDYIAGFKTTEGQSIDIPFKVRYIKTGGKMTGGTFTASVNFSVAYY